MISFTNVQRNSVSACMSVCLSVCLIVCLSVLSKLFISCLSLYEICILSRCLILCFTQMSAAVLRVSIAMAVQMVWHHIPVAVYLVIPVLPVMST